MLAPDFAALNPGYTLTIRVQIFCPEILTPRVAPRIRWDAI